MTLDLKKKFVTLSLGTQYSCKLCILTTNAKNVRMGFLT